MRTIEDTLKNAAFLQQKVYPRYELGTREEIKEMFIKSFIYFDLTIKQYEHLPTPTDKFIVLLLFVVNIFSYI